MGKGSRNRRMRATVTPMAGGGHLITMGSGVTEEIRQPPLPADRPGKHLWTVTAAWRIDPTKFDPNVPGAGLGIMDHENIIGIAGTGCYKCELEYTPDLAAQPCRGSLTEPMP